MPKRKTTSRPLALRYIPAGELRGKRNPQNWRKHPQAQLSALNAIIADPEVGWAGVLLFNERTDRLIDGHARLDGRADDERVPVLVGSWTPEAEKKILLTLDPLAAMAEPDTALLLTLLGEVDLSSDELSPIYEDLNEMIAAFDAEEAEAPPLASGDRAPIQQMTFTLSDEQAKTVKTAIQAAKASGPFVDTGNENSNGNGLARIAEAYIGKG